jgi:hypothetical protein
MSFVMVSEMAELSRDLAAFEAMRTELQQDHNVQWVVFFDAKLAGIYDSFNAAAADAVARFGRGPYLIRQVGAPEFTLPASVAYRIQ